jgi:hypothetical protein
MCQTSKGCREVSHDWRTPTGWDSVCRRSSGRRWYNSVRRTRAQMRRIAIMRTVTALPPPYGIWHLPYGMRAQLAQQFSVSTWIIYHDLKRLNAEDLQRFYMGLAQERERKERIMGARVTIRLPKALREHLADSATHHRVELSELVRHALQIYLNEGSRSFTKQPGSGKMLSPKGRREATCRKTGQAA